MAIQIFLRFILVILPWENFQLAKGKNIRENLFSILD
jgi:hypothetical protein